MKKNLWLITFLLCMVLVNTRAQSYDTVPYALDYHNARLDIFRKEPVIKEKIIFLGNSITQFGDWKTLLNDSTIVNRGIAGDNTFGVKDRLSDVIQRQPLKVFIEIGINDISQGVPDAVIQMNINSIVKNIRSGSPATKVFVLSVLPTNDSVKAHYPDAFGKNMHVRSVNTGLQTSAERNGYTFINLCSALSDANGDLDFQYAKADGIHLNPLGYAKWISILRKENCL